MILSTERTIAPLRSIDSVLLDLDGTLTDSAEGITKSVAYSLEKQGLPVPPLESIQWLLGPPIQSSFARLLGTDDKEKIAHAVTLYRERFATIGIFENALFDGVKDMLQALRDAGVTIYLATAKARVYAVRILDHFEIARYFEAVYGSELSGERTHKVDVITYALANSPINPLRTVMVGDREHDVNGAHDNGIPCIGVKFGYAAPNELEEAGAEYIVESVEELQRLLLRLSGPTD